MKDDRLNMIPKKTNAMKIKTLSLFCIIILVTALPGQLKQEEMIVSIKKTSESIRSLQKLGLDLLMEHNGRIYLLARIPDLSVLDQRKIIYRYEDELHRKLILERTLALDGINGAYHTYRELEQELMDLAQIYPHLARVIDIGDSHEDRNIYALKISDNTDEEEGEPGVIFFGCHHAREWISVEIPFSFGKYLLENYSNDPNIRNLVNHCEIWIIPLVNPDGLEYSLHYYRYWRKNRRANTDGSFGVDLNRNYNYKWGYDDAGSSPDPRSGLYRGTAPFSEPETSSIRDFIPGKNIKALISYHSYGRLIIYPWGYTNIPADDREMMHQMAAEMSKLIESVHGNIYHYGQAADSLYVANGDTTDWAYGSHDIPSFTVELPPTDLLNGGFINSEDDIQYLFEENLPAMLYLVNWTMQKATKLPD